MSKDFKPFRILGLCWGRAVWGEKGIAKICQNACCINDNLNNNVLGQKCV